MDKSANGSRILATASPRYIKPKTLMVLAGCALLLAGLGWVDRATGYELGLFGFYSAPVAAVAWNLGRGPGIVVAFIASGIWYLADRYAGDHYSSSFYGYWNTGMHFSTFIINAVTFAKIKSSLRQRHELERALEESRKQVKHLAGLIYGHQCDKPYIPDPLPAKEEAGLGLLPGNLFSPHASPHRLQPDEPPIHWSR